MRRKVTLALSALLLGAASVAWLWSHRANETTPGRPTPASTLLDTLKRARANAEIQGLELQWNIKRAESTPGERFETAPK